MTDLSALEAAVLAAISDHAAGRGKRGRAAQGTALVKGLAKATGGSPEGIERDLVSHSALYAKDVQAPRFFGLLRSTRPARGVALRTGPEVIVALSAGSPAPSSAALRAYCASALVAGREAPTLSGLDDLLTASSGPVRSLDPLSIQGAQRVESAGSTAGSPAARAKSDLARLKRFAPGSGYEFSPRLRVSAPFAVLEALLQGPPEMLAKALDNEELERWVRDDCGERELSDVFAATRLRARVEHLKPDALKRLFVRLLSFSPLREGVLLGLVPVFVSRLTTSAEKEVEQIVSALEGLGTETALESLVNAVFEVPSEARPRVLMALGAVGSPRVLEPLERLALHSSQKADRTEAAAAVLRIAGRHPGVRADEAVKALGATEDAEVRAMLGAPPKKPSR